MLNIIFVSLKDLLMTS